MNSNTSATITQKEMNCLIHHVKMKILRKTKQLYIYFKEIYLEQNKAGINKEVKKEI